MADDDVVFAATPWLFHLVWIILLPILLQVTSVHPHVQRLHAAHDSCAVRYSALHAPCRVQDRTWAGSRVLLRHDAMPKCCMRCELQHREQTPFEVKRSPAKAICAANMTSRGVR